MQERQYKILRTLRCRDVNIPGTLGALASTIGACGANIGNIVTVNLGQHYIVRDIDVMLQDEEHLKELLEGISRLRSTEVLEVRDEVLELHRGGKIKMISTRPINSVADLRKVYTPGVAEVCRKIQAEPSLRDLYTSIPTLVAIVTDGSAILGLGDIGPVAGMPVMEGKAALLQELAGISGVPILLDSKEPDEVVAAVKHIAPTFGGIQLEDFASPRCFDILERLQRELSIPVMQDDQQGTAVVVLATVINACHVRGLDIKTAKIGQIGLGAAGLVSAEMLYKYTGNPVLGYARSEASRRRHQQRGGLVSTLEEIMAKADVVISATGVKGLIKPEQVRHGQIILAISNPDPEILPEEALEAGAAVALDGKTVNNLCCYPGLWRGTLDSHAVSFTPDMYVAAAMAIAGFASEQQIIPDPLDRDLHKAVAKAVAWAAKTSGVARKALDEDYFA